MDKLICNPHATGDRYLLRGGDGFMQLGTGTCCMAGTGLQGRVEGPEMEESSPHEVYAWRGTGACPQLHEDGTGACPQLHDEYF